jgi:hypothetical protein
MGNYGLTTIPNLMLRFLIVIFFCYIQITIEGNKVKFIAHFLIFVCYYVRFLTEVKLSLSLLLGI